MARRCRQKSARAARPGLKQHALGALRLRLKEIGKSSAG